MAKIIPITIHNLPVGPLKNSFQVIFMKSHSFLSKYTKRDNECYHQLSNIKAIKCRNTRITRAINADVLVQYHFMKPLPLAQKITHADFYVKKEKRDSPQKPPIF